MPNVITLASAWVCNLKEFEKPRWSSPSFSSPHLTAFLIFSPCHLSGSSVIGTLTTCSGPAGFLSCKEKKKELCSMCHSQGLLTSARLFPFHYPSAQSFSPTLVLSAYLQISAYFFKNPTSRSCCRFICNFRSLVSLSVSVNLF